MILINYYALHCPLALSISWSINSEGKILWSRDSNPGLLGVEHERNHCTMPTPQLKDFLKGLLYA